MFQVVTVYQTAATPSTDVNDEEEDAFDVMIPATTEHVHHLHSGLLMEDEDPVLMSSNKDPTEDPADALIQLESDDHDRMPMFAGPVAGGGSGGDHDGIMDGSGGNDTSVQFSLDDLARYYIQYIYTYK